MTKLETWVYAQGGPIPLAKTLKMTPHAIRRWLRGEGTPTVRTTLELIRLSKGQLSFHGIIEDIVEQNMPENKIEILKEAQRLYDLGMGVHWIKPCSKVPVKAGWNMPTRDPWDVVKRDYRAGYGLGVRMGQASRVGDGYLANIDIDIKSSDPRHRKEAIQFFDEQFPGLKERAPIVATSYGFRVFVKTKLPVDSKKLIRSQDQCVVFMPSAEVSPAQLKALDEGLITQEQLDGGYRVRPAWEVEFMSAGKQVVLPPSIHPETKKPYAWKRGVLKAESIPVVEIKTADLKLSSSESSKVVFDFKPVEVDLSRLPERTKSMILEGKEDGIDIADDSAACLSITKAMFKRGYSDQEMVSVLTDKENYIGHASFRHTGGSSRMRAAQWAYSYCVVPAKEKYTAEKSFEEEVGVTPLLESDEGVEEQRLELEIKTPEELGFHTQGKGDAVKPNYGALLEHFKGKKPYKTIADMKAVYWFNGIHYEYITPIQIKAFAETHFNPKPTSRTRDEFLNKVLANEVETRRFFIDTIEDKINFNNGVLDLNDPIGGEWFWPHSPEYGFRGVLPYDFNPEATCPFFEEWLDSIMLGDRDLKAILQEFMGYIVRGGEYHFHKALWLGGEGRNGKSTFVNLLKQLIGPGNFSTVSIKSLVGDKFAAADLDGKIANFSEETSPEEIADSGPFKNLTGDGDIFAQKKYGDPYFFRNRAKLIMTYNEIPYLKDLSGGMLSRPLIVPFLKTIQEGEQDHGIHKKLKKELSGIFNFALQGWKRLSIQKQFTESELSKTAVKKILEESCNVHQWVEQEIEFVKNDSDEFFRRSGDLYTKYKSDERYAYSRDKFLKRLMKHAQMRLHHKIKKLNGRTERGYFGIQFRSGF